MKRHCLLWLLLLNNVSLFSMDLDLGARLTALKKRTYSDFEAARQQAPPAPEPAQNPNIVRCTRRTYAVPEFDQQKVTYIMQKFGLCKPIAQTLCHRGLTVDAAINDFLNPTYDAQARHPSLLKDASKAVERISRAIANKEKIRIIADYDVDGMTSATLMLSCLRPLNAIIDYHCPHRIKDGYGIRPKHIEQAKADGCTLVITVDNGISAFDAGKKAKELGIDLLITDHHQEQDQLPEAYAIVNPNQKQCTYPCKALAGVGVAFKLMQLLYGNRQLDLPPKAYELMMLGTIADVVPLIDENRYWVRIGFERAQTWRSPALIKLMSNAQVESPTISSTDIAFGIAPQLNAIGRLDDANLGVRFLLDQDNPLDREAIGNFLKAVNEQRKNIQHEMFQSLNDMVYKDHSLSLKDPIFIASNPAWHPGINGLIAAKAVEKWYKPTIIMTEVVGPDGTIMLKGSGRSISKYHLFEGLKACKDLLVTFGGHPAAAGLMMPKSKLAEFKTRLAEHFTQNVLPKDRAGGAEVDGLATFADLTPKIAADLKLLEPFGNSNPAPCLYLGKVRTTEKQPSFMGKGHVKATLEQQHEEKKEEAVVNFFFRPDAFYLLKDTKGAPFDLVGTVNDNWYNGNHTIGVNAIDLEKMNYAKPKE